MSLRATAAVFAFALVACGRGAPASEPDADATDAAVHAGPGADAASDADLDAGGYSFPCLTRREPTGEATFEAVYIDILCRSGCTTFYCHGSRGRWGGLDLGSVEVAYAALVDASAGRQVPVDGRASCVQSPLVRVAPGEPGRSLFYLKLAAMQPCGTSMPPPDSEWPPIEDDELRQVRAWIEAGAPLR